MFEVMDPSVDEDDAVCRVCERPLRGDPDDQPDPPHGPMCGECYRAREFDQSMWEMGAGPGDM